ncbi:MAG: hypothetical protein HY720_03990 [Planctomycetes bacterium]|nr:hypothetical protein [Planctomycetota bacterium]
MGEPQSICPPGCYRVPEGVVDRNIGEELLVHRFDTDEVFVLNPHARLVFEAAKCLGDGESVRRDVASRVLADTSEVFDAVGRTLEEMVAKGILAKE